MRPAVSNDVALAHRDRTGSLGIQPYARHICPTCLQSLPTHTASSWETQLDSGPDSSSLAGVIADRDYFNTLARSLRIRQTPLALSDGSGEYHRRLVQEDGDADVVPLVPSSEAEAHEPTGADISATSGVAESSFNQGYYERFFSEQRKLGKGLRGSVFSCQHILDSVYLGHYAVKKVAVGNNHQWLKRMLREVKLLESLRHPNVVEYKHSWLEMHQMTAFGPKVPCLFILMEYANGGNLQEYMEPKGSRLDGGDSSVSLKQKILNRRRQSEGLASHEMTSGLRVLTVEQIWSFFADICSGLAHLHQLQIIHRDLKHMNLLLHWKDPDNKDTDGEMPRIMLTDFGECEILSHIEKRDRTGATGTMEFMAPELLEVDSAGRYLDSYSTKSDMWSLGMVLYYLCYSQLPFANIDDIDILRKDVLVFRHVDFAKVARPAGADPIPSELRRIMQMLLNHDETRRPDVSEVIQLVTEHRELWHSRRHGESRFEVHDSDMLSSHTNTPRVATPPIGSKNSPRGFARPSRLSHETRVGTFELPNQTSTAPLALVCTPEHALVQSNVGHDGLVPTAFRRHSTGHQSFQESGATTPLTGYSGDSDTDGSVFVTPAYEHRHDSAITELPKDGTNQSSSHSSSTGHCSRTKRHISSSSNNSDDGGGQAAKRQRLITGMDIGPAFCVKTGILLAKAYSLQRLGVTYGDEHMRMPYLTWVSLVISAFDLHHRSLRLSFALLAANAAIIYCWLYF
ncbi:putative serine/threonine-protein kinase iks1 [Coemansia sp. RSA 2708]|nr:putative serine/threonine-protein kinase iks1 [Coemansia sp. RSA 2708]